jgi:hypothetical protein
MPVVRCVPSKRGALGFLFDRLRLADANEPSFGDIHFAIRKAHTLRNAEPGRIALRALKAREPGTLLEEVHEGSLEIRQRLLQRLGIHGF